MTITSTEAVNVLPRTSVTAQLLHDLRSPLNQIIGYSEMLSESAESEPATGLMTDLQKIGAAGHRMLALIEENFTAAGESVTATADQPVAKRAAAAAASGPSGGLVLVVDDDAANRDVLSRRLARQGHIVVTASDGRAALNMMRDSAFDLVLMDIMMPEIDGFEVLTQMKSDQRLQHIPVIMISALSEVQSVVRCIEAGAEDYLTKPFNPTLLKARIGACLDKKRGRDREKELYDQLQQNFKRLQEAEKLRDDMRNMIVHDLRTPLTSVIVGVEMLGALGTLSDSQRETVGIALAGGKTLMGMINDLLDVEKMESGANLLQYEQLSASSLVSGAFAQLAPLAEEARIVLVTDIDPAVPPFAGDQKKLSRTLVNLIANAIKFTRSGTVTAGASVEGENIRFAVRDTGQGIPLESFDRIFEKFGQLDARRVGTGLGLAFCKLAVESHGGRIKVESTPGVGSTFSFTIPIVAKG